MTASRSTRRAAGSPRDRRASASATGRRPPIQSLTRPGHALDDGDGPGGDPLARGDPQAVGRGALDRDRVGVDAQETGDPSPRARRGAGRWPVAARRSRRPRTRAASRARRGSRDRRAHAAPPSRRSPSARSSGGKRTPTSPSPAAPSSASMSAWSATSPSEWPSGPAARRRTSTPREAHRPPRRPTRCASNPIPARAPVAIAAASSGDGARGEDGAHGRDVAPASVSLRLAGSPGTTWTGAPAGGKRAGVVGDRPVPGVRLLDPRPQLPERAACGVWAATTSSRSTWPMTTSVAHPLQRVGHRHDRDDRRGRPRPRQRRPTRRASGVTAGRAASWTRTSVSSSWPVPARAQMPAMTESARVVAARHDEAAVRRRRPAGHRVNRSTASAATTTATSTMPGAGEQRVEAPAPGRTAPEIGPQLVAAHPLAAAGGDEDGGERERASAIGPGVIPPRREAGRRSCGRRRSGGRG